MEKFKFNASATVSCFTEIEAETLEEALEIASDRDLAGLVHSPHTSSLKESWHFENDGTPFNIELED